MFDLKHGNVLSIFQKNLCYHYNHLGVIPFEYIAGVTRDGKFAGTMINQSTEIALMDEWTKRMQKEFCKVITYLFYFCFL